MSIMNDLSNEILKPVKTGLYVGAAVVTVGGLAIAANSDTGREFLGNVSNAVKGKPNNVKEKDTQQGNTPNSGNKVHDDAVNLVDDNYNVNDSNNTQPITNVKGSSNV